jgi:hypothetical protein
MKHAVNCNAYIDTDSFIEEIRDDWSEEDKLKFIECICDTFDNTSAFKKLRKIVDKMEEFQKKFEKD